MTDLLFFDGASNVQIAGQVIAAIYPRITCLHGVKHNTALVFSDWGKILAIKVSYMYFILIIVVYITINEIYQIYLFLIFT